MNTELLKSSFLQNLAVLPSNKPIVCLIRHAEREPFLPGDIGNKVNLTNYGQASCQSLAKVLNQRVNKIYSSSVKRCLQTAHLLAVSAIDSEVTINSFLGNPGVFIINPAKVNIYFQQQNIIDIVKYLLSSAPNKPGFCHSTSHAIMLLMQFMLDKAALPGIYLFITHDAILSTVLGYLFNDIAIETLWPNYLEGLFIWQSTQSFYGAYRDICKPLPWLIK